MHGWKKPREYIKDAYQRLFGCSVSKTWTEIYQVEAILNAVNYERIIELGTGSGSLTVFMAAHAAVKSKLLHSFDNKHPSDECLKVMGMLGASFLKCDIFIDEEFIGKLIDNDGLTILYCDNGNKPKEMDVFAKYMKRGDIMLIHDYPDEVKDFDIENVKYAHGLDDWNKEWFEEFLGITGGSMHRALVKS